MVSLSGRLTVLACDECGRPVAGYNAAFCGACLPLHARLYSPLFDFGGCN